MNTKTDNIMQDTQLDGMYRMASKFLGYTGPKTKAALEQFRQSSPAVAAKMKRYNNAMAKGGLMRKGYADGGLLEARTMPIEDKGVNPTSQDLAKAQQDIVMQTMTPYRPEVAPLQETAGQIVDVASGQTTAAAAPQAPVAVAPIAAQGIAPQPTPSAQAEVSTVAPEVSATLAGVEAATGQVSPQAQVAAATQATTSVANVEAAQGTAVMMDNPVQREIQAGELISGAADAEKAAAFTEQIEAATATPSKKATVAGQLEGLMAEFEGGNTPAWAAGAMRTAMQTLSARGLGASSMAGQAVVQAAMEASLPIAAADAQTVAQFEVQNLSNKQQRAMLAAQ